MAIRNKVRILHVLRKLDRGGVETWLVHLLRHIDRRKYQIDFMVHTTDPGAYDEEVRTLGAHVIPCLGPSTPAQYAFNFRRILREYGPYDVVHSHVHHYSGYVLMLAAIAGVPVRIAHSHSSAPEASESIPRQLYLKLMRHLIKMNASAGLVVSSCAGDALMPNWRDIPSWHLAPCGIEMGRFDVEVDRSQIRSQFGLRQDARVVGHVGRFDEVKNQRLIIEISEELSYLEPRIVFLMVGDGPTRPGIQAEITRRGMSERFVFTGSRADVPAILKGAMDAFVFPSLYEGLGIALMEAQLAGLRCVASNTIPSEAELVPGMVSWLSLSDSPKKWARVLHSILKASETWSVPRAARRQHSIESSVSRLATLYDSAQWTESVEDSYQATQQRPKRPLSDCSTPQ